ncbi:two-component regulator propeller domain-containing protein [Algivirga pacifica]|uniref:PPM-type phosphatase domain-containing protein n=1 Tax=Algivirga pacifica TaxID=1162670 RepID=A0ABP9DDJ9_9BACT
MYVKLFQLLLSLFLGISFVQAQQYHITQYTNREGLAQNHSVSLAMDSKGYLWIGSSEGGVSRFDGHTFDVYDTSNGLSSNFIQKVTVDALDNVWVQTSKGLHCLDGQKVHYLHTEGTMTVHSQDSVYIQGPKYTLEVCTPTGLLPTYIKSDKAYNHIAHNQKKDFLCARNNQIELFSRDGHLEGQWELPHSINNITAAFQEDAWWIGTIKGLYLLQNKHLSSPYPELEHCQITSILPLSSQRLWIGTQQNGAILCTPDGLKILKEENGLSNNIQDILADQQGGIWFAGKDGIFRLHNLSVLFYPFKKERIQSTLSLHENGIVATSQKRLYFFHKELLTPLPYPKNISTSDKKLFAIHQTPYILSKDRLYYPDSSRTFIRRHRFSYKDVPENEVFKAAIEWQKSIYIAGKETLYSSKYSLDSLNQVPSPTTMKGISCLAATPQALWVGTQKDGIFRLDTKGNFKQFTLNDGLSSLHINTLITDKKNNLWVGTSGGGLLKISTEEQVTTYQEENFTSTNIYSLEFDPYGNLWAGSDRGMNKIIFIQNDYLKVERYQGSEGITQLEYSKNSSCIDHKGQLWFGSSEGIYCINPEKDLLNMIPPKTYLTGINVNFQDASLMEYADHFTPWHHVPVDLSLPHGKNHLTIYFSGVTMDLPEKVKYQWRLSGIDQAWTTASKQSFANYSNLPAGNYTFEVKSINARGLESNDTAVLHFEIDKPFYFTKLFLTVVLGLLVVLIRWWYKQRVSSYEKAKAFLRKKVAERTEELEQQRSKLSQQSQAMQKQHEELNGIYERMSNSLQYAGKIQEAILLKEDTFSELLPQSFTLFQPKETVAGVFFWVHQHQEHIHLALIDCTNRGVPAAFISIVGKEMLTRVVQNFPKASPAEILELLHEEFVSVLHAESKAHINDGMDIAYCDINLKERILTFAGARRPLFVMEEGIIREYKGDFCSIGIQYNNKIKNSFTNQVMPLKEGNTYYLFSDGFTNQFDQNGKKFKKSQLKALLEESASYRMEEQKQILSEAFQEWKGDVEQLDDILFVGFKVTE